MCLPVNIETMHTFEAEYPCFTRVSALVLGFGTFKFVLKNEFICKEFDSPSVRLPTHLVCLPVL